MASLAASRVARAIRPRRTFRSCSPRTCPTTLAEDPALAGACSDTGDDPFPMFTNCPVPIGWFASGGAGPLVDTHRRSPVDHRRRRASLRQQRRARRRDRRGHAARHRDAVHRRRADPQPVPRRSTTSGAFLDPNAPCSDDPAALPDRRRLGRSRYRTRYTAAYVEDTWHAAPNIQVDGGLRWELMWVGTALHFSERARAAARRRAGIRSAAAARACGRAWAAASRCCPRASARPCCAAIATSTTSRSPFGDEPRRRAPARRIAVADRHRADRAGRADRRRRGRARADGARDARGRRAAGCVAGSRPPPTASTTRAATATMPRIARPGLVALEVATSPTAKLVLRVGYMCRPDGRLVDRGVRPAPGRRALHGDDFDVHDQPARARCRPTSASALYIEAERSGARRPGDARVRDPAHAARAGGRAARSADTDDGIIYLLPRGSRGRGPMLTPGQRPARGHVARRRPRRSTCSTCSTAATRPASTRSTPAARSIRSMDGDVERPRVSSKTETGGSRGAARRFQVPTAFQAPLSAVLGIRTPLLSRIDDASRSAIRARRLVLRFFVRVVIGD